MPWHQSRAVLRPPDRPQPTGPWRRSCAPASTSVVKGSGKHGHQPGAVDALLPSAAALSGWSLALRIPEARGFDRWWRMAKGYRPGAANRMPLRWTAWGWTGAAAAVPAGQPLHAGRDAQEPWAAAIQQLVTPNRLAGVVIYGSPYLWENPQAALPNDCPAAYSAGQMPEASARCSPRCSPPLQPLATAVPSPMTTANQLQRPTASNLAPTSAGRPCSASR